MITKKWQQLNRQMHQFSMVVHMREYYSTPQKQQNPDIWDNLTEPYEKEARH